MRTFYETDIRRRTKVLAAFLAAWALVVAARLVQVQVLGHAKAKAAVLRQALDETPIEPRRGDILDRNGEILACSLPSPSVVARPVAGEKPEAIRSKVQALKRELGLTEKEAAVIRDRLAAGAAFTYVKRKVPEETAARVMGLKIAGVELEPGTRRYYPLGPLAAQVLGGINLTGESSRGIEYLYNKHLAGEKGRQISYQVNGRRDYQTRVIEPPVPGRDLVLTIDATVQYIAEKELARAVAEHGAAWGAVAVMDPPSGEVLAMASWPTYDPNDYPGPQEAWLNRPVGVSYEPGSTFKIITAAAARERGRVGFGEVFDCSAGSIRVANTVITDHEREHVLSFPQVLIKSSNVGTVLFAQRLTNPEFYETLRAFGIGAKTGIELPGEETGLLRPPDEWNRKVSLPHIAIGYEVMVSPLQMLRAMNVFATGGLLVRPRIVRDRAGEDSPKSAPARAISEKTSTDLVERVFEAVVEEGTAKGGRLDGYRVAGKTGTAKKVDPATGAYIREYRATFVGFTPVERPRLSMIVVLDSPKEHYYGGQACAPVFRDIARQVLRYLRVAPERPLPPTVLTAGREPGRAR
ncbi:MAG: penicillin-binding protein 2 [Candidatus Aminicenantes bacterium]|nr:penicillin-binding protein 2 [Candidatus Aminicenantes bacterium]NLH77084.1 penicillin-binding protein 2 [Acidobacteriota bacterium]